ncbi:putative WD repeat-containing protein C2A9.03 [Bidens hawaiensis]|uniref:putative WD repeat-containing protein C2A9.03 n=1 Tax=Bidens hawaiensis TaxID=980011 RepID=UPI00404A413B
MVNTGSSTFALGGEWEQVAIHVNLMVNDHIAFEHIRDSSFRMHVFDKNGIERHFDPFMVYPLRDDKVYCYFGNHADELLSLFFSIFVMDTTLIFVMLSAIQAGTDANPTYLVKALCTWDADAAVKSWNHPTFSFGLTIEWDKRCVCCTFSNIVIRVLCTVKEPDYMAEDRDMPAFVDNVDEDENDAGDQNLTVRDTSSAQARRGKDIQGVPWERLGETREMFRRARLGAYRNFENLRFSGDAVDMRYRQKPSDGKYYDFFYNSRAVRPTFFHVQLRNLVWATSKHDVYLLSSYSIMHWSALSKNLTETLNFSGHIAPTEKHDENLLEGFTEAKITAFAVKDGFLVAGGSEGELICKRLEKPGVSFCARTNDEDNTITTAIEICNALSGGMRCMVSNNTFGIKEYEMDGYQLVNHFRFSFTVNQTSLSPDRKLIAVVGDRRDALLADATNGMTVASMKGHLDYSFASAWHGDGRIVATGNQDKTCMVWDVRNLANPVSVLKGKIAAVRSLRFSSDGQFLVVAEAADFVNVYNTALNYEKRQEIDFFGEISGVSLSPDDVSLFIGVWDPNFHSLLLFNRRHRHEYLDSLF